MRILPYFQSIQTAARAQADARAEMPKAADKAEGAFHILEGEEPEIKRPADKFIPASPVTGVVYSLSEEARAQLEAAAKALPGSRTAGVVKSGQYGFYRLDGRSGQGLDFPGRQAGPFELTADTKTRSIKWLISA